MQFLGKTLREIWSGNAALTRAFWVHYVLIYSVLVIGGYVVISRWFNTDGFHWSVLGYLVFAALIYIFLFVGLVRSAGRHIKEGGNVQFASVYQALGLIGGLGITYIGLDIIQLGTDDYTPLKHAFDASERQTYTYEVNEAQDTIQLSGILDLGATKALRELVLEYPNIKWLRLVSEGGHIYAARGVAKVVQEYQFDTHVPTSCSSACVVVFAAGKKRTMADGAKLGFHQYAFETSKPLPFNLQDEQQKEVKFYLNRGVRQEFVDKIFSLPCSQLWQPDNDELLQSGLVHEFIPSS